MRITDTRVDAVSRRADTCAGYLDGRSPYY